jgi:hypothetical protein
MSTAVVFDIVRRLGYLKKKLQHVGNWRHSLLPSLDEETSSFENTVSFLQITMRWTVSKTTVKLVATCHHQKPFRLVSLVSKTGNRLMKSPSCLCVCLSSPSTFEVLDRFS